MRIWPSSEVSIEANVPVTVPASTSPNSSGFEPACSTASSIPASGFILSQATTPTATAVTAMNSTAPIASDPMIARGTSRAGLRASSLATVTVSNPIYAKNTSAALLTMPPSPSGANGWYAPGRTAPARPSTNATSATNWITTSPTFVPADSRIPIASRTASSTIAIAAIRSICECARSSAPPANATCAVCAQPGSVKPSFANSCCSEAESVAASGATENPYSRIRSQPITQATNSPSAAYAYVYALPATGTIVPSPTAISAFTPSTRRSGTPSEGRRARSCGWRANRSRISDKTLRCLELDHARFEVEAVEQDAIVFVGHIGPLLAEHRDHRRFDDVRPERAAAEIRRGRDQPRDPVRTQEVDVGGGDGVGEDRLAVEPLRHELPHEVVVAGDDLRVVVVFGVFRLRGAVLFLPGRIEELERQLARVREILARHLLELVEPAHRAVEIEREDEIAEDDVGAGLHQRLCHPEPVERADHQHPLPAQLDSEVRLHERDRAALERVLQPAPVDDRRDLHRVEQPQPVAQRIAVAPGVQVHVDPAESDRIDRPVELLQLRDRLVDRSVPMREMSNVSPSSSTRAR